MTDQPAQEIIRAEPETSPGFLSRLVRNRLGATGLLLVGLLLIGAIASALGWVPFDPVEQHPPDRLTGPSATYWFGTDQFGRDVFSRVLAGLKISFQVAIVAVGIAAVIGTTFGVLAGFMGGWVETVTMRIADSLFAFPAILLALVIVTALGTGWFNAAIAIAVVYTPVFIRVSRGPTLQIKSADYVKAGVGLGFSTPRLIFGHVLPNISSAVIVQITLSLSWAILTESALSFLGLGTQPPDASLGLMVSTARGFAVIAWWSLVFPSLGIVLAVLGLNLLGDGLRDALDPSRRDL
ncbi:MAG: ABC transporter permease [Actinomycetota bacterium]